MLDLLLSLPVAILIGGAIVADIAFQIFMHGEWKRRG